MRIVMNMNKYKYNKLQEEIYKWFSISFAKFGRSTTEEQSGIAQDIFWNLQDSSEDQFYCTHCSRFIADKFVEGECHKAVGQAGGQPVGGQRAEDPCLPLHPPLPSC